MKHTATLLAAIFGLTGCNGNILKALPEDYMIGVAFSDPSFSVPVSAAGVVDVPAVEKMFLLYRRTPVAVVGTDGATVEIADMSVRFELVHLTKPPELVKVRSFFSLDINLPFGGYGFTGSLKGATQDVVELDAGDRAIHFFVKRATVRADDLFLVHRRYERQGKAGSVLFSRFISAPDVFVTHRFSKALASVGYAGVFRTDGEVEVLRFSNYSGQPVLRRLQNTASYSRLLENKTPMFVEDPNASVPAPNPAVDPGALVYVDDQGKKFRLSEDYAQHLRDEGVVITTEPDPETIPRAADEGFLPLTEGSYYRPNSKANSSQ